MFPLMVNCAHKKIVIIGGGSVAARKAAYFSDADVIMYSKTFHPDVPAYVTCISCTIVPDRDAIQRIIKDAFLVIVATSDPALNTFIVDITRDEKVLCNCADGEAGDVIIPAQIQRGEIVIAVSSGGTSPALSQFLRIHLEEMFPELEQIAAFLEVLKLELKQSIFEQKRRSIILQKALRDPVLLEEIGVAKSDMTLRSLAVRYIEENNCQISHEYGS
jgi:precorrin-2 dehydrogenase/sirohydrochlorin ferrochelatase